MKILRKNLPKSIVELIVEDKEENFEKYRKEAIKHLSEHAEVKWFRKWAKIPEDVIIRQFWDEYINARAMDIAIENMYTKALKKENIYPIAQWQIKEIVSEKPLSIKIHIEVLPEVEIDEKYKKVSLKKKKVEVSDEEVENAIKDIENRFTQYVEDEKGKAEMWDKVTISTEWYEKDKLLENTSMQSYPLILGSNILVPWFEEKIVWMKKWETKDLDITFPKDYHNKDFAWKKTIFKTTVELIEKAKKPEFTPEFIEQLRWRKLDLEWFKKLIKEEIKDTKEANARMEDERELIDELVKITKMDIWDSLLFQQTERVFQEIRNNMAQDWLEMINYLESLKLSEEQYKDNHVKPVALKRLQWELIFHKLRELETIEVSDEEVEAELNLIREKFQNPEVLEKLNEMYKKGSKNFEELRERLKFRKLIDSFFKE